MGNESEHKPYPLWVRFAAREGMKRSAAVAQVRTYIIVAGGGFCWMFMGLLNQYIEPPIQSFLIANGLPIGLTGIVLGVSGALWCWLSMRWVDRNGTWA